MGWSSGRGNYWIPCTRRIKKKRSSCTNRIQAAISSNDPEALKKATTALRELLFFVEGH